MIKVKSYVELAEEVRKSMNLKKETRYNLYTLPNHVVPVKFTDIGLVHADNNSFMDYPLLLEIVLGTMDIKKVNKLPHREVFQHKKLENIYKLFDISSWTKKLKELLQIKDNTIRYAIDDITNCWITSIETHPAFCLDIIMPFVEETIKERDCIIETTSDLCGYVLDYIFDDYISANIVYAIAYNELADIIDFEIESATLYNKICSYFDWSYTYKENIDGLLEELKEKK